MHGAENIVFKDGMFDETLTSYSESYIQDANDFISNQVATVIPVRLEAGTFWKYPRSYFYRDEMALRPHGGTPVQVRYGIEEDTYFVQEYAAEHIIDDRDRAKMAVPGINLDFNATKLLTQKALIRRDRQWATTFFKTGVWGTDLTGIASGTPSSTQFLQWDQAAANPIRDVAEAREKIMLGTGKRANVMVLGARAYEKLRQAPALIDLFKYTQGGLINIELIRDMFEVDRVVICRTVYNSADEQGVTKDAENLQYIIDPDSAWLGYVEPEPMQDAPTAVAMFVWTGYEAGLAGTNMGGIIRRGRDDRARSDWFQITDAMAYRAVATELGVFFNKVIAPAQP